MNSWPRWIGDWKKKTTHLTLAEKGAYGELLDHAYITESPLPLDNDALYRVCGAVGTKECAAVDKVLKEFFIKDDAGYSHLRVNEEISKRQSYVATQKELADRRWAKEREKKKDAPPKKINGVDTIETWGAYSVAYAKRYGQPPVRNARVNSQMSNFVKCIGAQDAPQVAAFFLTHNNSFYVTKGHAVGILLSDAEKLRTEWATGRRTTQTDARQQDKRQGLANSFAPLIEEAEAREKLPK